jgi:hypothetical protein
MNVTEAQGANAIAAVAVTSLIIGVTLIVAIDLVAAKASARLLMCNIKAIIRLIT